MASPARQVESKAMSSPRANAHASRGYYAVYFRGPDRLKFEVVHMPLAEQRARSLGPSRTETLSSAAGR